MAPLVVLVAVSLVARAAGALGVPGVGLWASAIAVGLSAMFLLTASVRLNPRRRAGLVAIVPPGMPAPGALVALTGAFEVAGAVGLLVPPSLAGWVRPVTAVCLGVLLLAMFPANVRAARGVRHPDAPSTPLVRRAAIQTVFVLACVVVAAG